ncbi:aminotransferase class I/II-fold pyridoxal phosphate-dependent enzyme [Paenibacillus oralis]|uniref:Aminotransferase class I/II-fold pyridoxal phosphate-dependent enzyme n=1 Tax=Paenibacillus oralis TaxID=2490856 RepID=A0A3P3TYV9_9BACL|nr:aminotransferase class I/II-fold pyridoxal phosphate-dependent enzyme [Paenibacillus oralis]RRJ63030.1 aminotransferase class I/II-fold pyridoxal phosphate-dependent enzyme [Paenibacillus oralis]
MPEQVNRAPLYEALMQYMKKSDVSFHVPGHKNGQALRGGMPWEQDLLSRVMEIDATEITGTDDLHHPEGVIREAQQLAAAQFGAEETFFLVGGSTAGNLALILSVCTAPGDVLLVQRNVHKSVIHGLMLAGAHAVFLAPRLDARSGLATTPSVETVREALRRHPGAKGLLVTHPSYYGMGASLRPLAELCRAHSVPLLVDEAHGAHFGQHPALPESALAQGADGVVQSTHKMLTALTMGAMLHVQGGLLDRALLRQRLAMLQSSSPSYPIMASLDVSRSLLAAQGPALFAGGLAKAAAARSGLGKLPRFGVVKPPGASGGDAAYTIQDPFKLVIYDATNRWSGYELQRRLEAEGCVPEMSDERYVVLAFGPGTTERDAGRLLQALERIAVAAEAAESASEKAEEKATATAAQAATQLAEKREAEQDCSGAERDPSAELSTWNISLDPKPADAAIRNAEARSQTDAGIDVQVTGTLTDAEPADSGIDADQTDILPGISEPVAFSLAPLSPEEIEAIPVEDSAGRQAAEMIIPYPPGIPLLYPGETVTEETKRRLLRLRQTRAKCQGAADPLLLTIQVKKLIKKAGNEPHER